MDEGSMKGVRMYKMDVCALVLYILVGVATSTPDGETRDVVGNVKVGIVESIVNDDRASRCKTRNS